MFDPSSEGVEPCTFAGGVLPFSQEMQFAHVPSFLIHLHHTMWDSVVRQDE